jgi:magnesium transporter
MIQERVIGDPPGSLEGGTPPTRMSVFAYGAEELWEREVECVGDVSALRDRFPVVWLDVDGPVDEATLTELASVFGLHPLALEDVLHGKQRPKTEVYPDHVFMVVQLATFREDRIHLEQIGLFLGRGFVLTFQTEPGDPFDPVRLRIRGSLGLVRSSGADHLAYALIDIVVDHYFPLVDILADKLEELEEKILSEPSKTLIDQIAELRRKLSVLRKPMRPMREAVVALAKPQTPLVTDRTRLYLRDAIDHAQRLTDAVDHQWEYSRGLVDMDVATSAQHLNEVMKLLTVISTIFIPLGFLAGLYGMNFDGGASDWNMPELRMTYGYPVLLGVMVLIVVGLLWWFRRRKWW